MHFTEFCTMRHLIFLFSVLLLFACRDSGNQLVVVPEQLALRDTSGQKSSEILFLKKGEKVEDLGLVSNFETIIALQGGMLQSPWIKVSSKNRQGWALAALFIPVDEERAQWLENKRMICYFGNALTQRRARWLASAETLQTEGQVADHYREAVALRDTFMSVLADRAEPSQNATPLDFSWLQTILPGFIAQKVVGRDHPYLFANFTYWLQMAGKSTGDSDDLFFGTCAGIFPLDSIESFFPSWKFQIDDLSAASQLGSGAHLKALAEIDKNLAINGLFKNEMLRWKENLLTDIAGKDIVYWQPVEKILAELKKIEESNFSCLEARDQMVLQTRLKAFEDPAANGIRVNVRSGE